MEHYANEGEVQVSEALFSTRHLPGKSIRNIADWHSIFLHFYLNPKVMERSRIYDEPISNIEKLIENGRYLLSP